MRKQSSHLAVFGQLTNSKRTSSKSLPNDPFQPHKRPAADEQQVLGVEPYARLHRLLPTTLRGHCGDHAFHHLEQAVLNAKPQTLPASAAHPQLVDLVDVSDSSLGEFDVPAFRLEQPVQQALHIIPDIARLGERSRIADHQSHVETGSQGLDHVARATAGSSDQEDVGFFDSHIVQVGIGHDRVVVLQRIDDPLEAVAYPHSDPFLGDPLSHDELV
jgi:hypothetical protein